MAKDQQDTNTGGNKPKPASNGQSAKERSKAQSRSISAKAPTGKSGKATGAGGKGGNTPRPGAKASAPPPPRKMSGAMMAWGAVGLVIIVVAVLVIVKVTTGSSKTTSSHQAVLPATPALVREISTVPTSVLDKVGTGIPSQYAGNLPIVISGQPSLTLDGKTPTMMYFGAEYCPYCAAERWSMAVALARFGTWHGLETTASGLNDGDYSTLTFRNATFDSPYIHFVPIETCTNIVNPNVTGCSGYTKLQAPTKAEQAVLSKYASSAFLPGNTNGVSFPYVDIDNKVLISGSTFMPAVLTGLSQSDIAGGLTDPTNPVTQSIVGTANYITAAICASTKGAPTSVCASSGVQAASKALKLS